MFAVVLLCLLCFLFFFFNDTATTEIYTLSLHDALPVPSRPSSGSRPTPRTRISPPGSVTRSEEHTSELQSRSDLVCRLLLEKKKHDDLLPQSAHPEPGHFGARFLFLLPSGSLYGTGALGELGDLPFFFFNDTATTEIYTLSLHDALPI